MKAPPASLFRYQRFSEWLRPVIVESALYFPILSELNDPCEFCYHVDVTWDDAVAARQVERLRSSAFPTTAVEKANPGMEVRAFKDALRALPPHELLATLKQGYLSQTVAEREEMLEAQLRIDASSIGMCCLTECRASGYMSYNYAHRHTGVCLEFSTGHQPFSSAEPVAYQQEPPLLRLISDDAYDMQRSRMFVKSTEWAQEREWRLVNHRVNDGPIVQFAPQALVSIAVGPAFDDRNLPVLAGWLTERRELGHAIPALCRLRRKQTSYELERQSLDLGTALV